MYGGKLLSNSIHTLEFELGWNTFDHDVSGMHIIICVLERVRCVHHGHHGTDLGIFSSVAETLTHRFYVYMNTLLSCIRQASIKHSQCHVSTLKYGL